MKRHLTLVGVLFACLSLAFSAGAVKLARKHYKKDNLIPLSADSVQAYDLLYFAQNLIGTRYCPASSNPAVGFDCSGFVSYVFKSFNVNVPRSSCEFINVGEKINIEDARPGDVILFTGTKSHHLHSIGHVGIVYANDNGELKFIHSTSGKEYGVTISPFDANYKRRFVQVVRLLKQNNSDLLAYR